MRVNPATDTVSAQCRPCAAPLPYVIVHVSAAPTNVDDDSVPSAMWLHPLHASPGTHRSAEPESMIRLYVTGGVPSSTSAK